MIEVFNLHAMSNNWEEFDKLVKLVPEGQMQNQKFVFALASITRNYAKWQRAKPFVDSLVKLRPTDPQVKFLYEQVYKNLK